MWNTINDLLGSTILHPQYFAEKGEYVCIEEVRNHAHGTFLDIGCGRQWYRNSLEPLFKKYIALDHPQIKSKYKSNHPIEYEADAEHLPLSDKSVNVAMMNLVIEHIANPEKALQEVKRVLKRDGLFIIYAVENYPVHGDIPVTFQHFTRNGLRELFLKLGFKIKKTRSFGNFWQTKATYQNVYFMEVIKKTIRFNRFAGVLLLCVLSPCMIVGNIIAYILGSKNTSDFSLGNVFVVSI